MITYRITLILLIFFSFPKGLFAADEPTVYEGADQYDAPGLVKGRVYSFDSNLSIDTFSGVVQLHQQDFSFPGTGPTITINRSYNSSIDRYETFEQVGSRWSLHFGFLKNTGNYAFCSGDSVNLPYGSTFVKPDGSQQLLLKPALFIDTDPDDGEFNDEVDYRPDFITPDLWRLECEGAILVVTDDKGLKYHVGNIDNKYHVIKVEDYHGNYFDITYDAARPGDYAYLQELMLPMEEVLILSMMAIY